jgi:P27 family predicted phage terminase small subunit
MLPRCPPHLSEEAKREWRRVSKLLYRLGLLTELDTTALSLYCQTFSQWVEAERKLASFGMLIKTPSDLPLPSPYRASPTGALTSCGLCWPSSA